MESGGAGVRGGASRRAPERQHEVESYDPVQSHHARGACESISVGVKMGSSSVVDTHKTRDKVGFGLVFFGGGQRKPLILRHAARFARVEDEVRKNSKAEDF